MNNKLGFVIVITIFFSSCIEKYFEYGEDDSVIIVVDGLINDNSPDQTIVLSTAAQIGYPSFNPLINCDVVVFDMEGNSFEFIEDIRNLGHYEGIIDTQYLFVGNQFKLVFETPNNEIFESEYEEYLPCKEIENITYEIKKNIYSEENDIHEDGIQFYISLKNDQNNYDYFRYKLKETYEYHSTWPILRYWAGEWMYETDASKTICYKSENISNVYVTGISHINENDSFSFPVNFVGTSTQRLYYKYSLLVQQLSLTENAYAYWLLLQKNQNESGGLFDMQPAIAKGNILCKSNSNVSVLGYFGVSSIKERRIIIERPTELEFLNNDLFCAPELKSIKQIMGYGSDYWPIYITPIETINPLFVNWAPQDCFDCTLKGGTTEKPDFWDNY